MIMQNQYACEAAEKYLDLLEHRIRNKQQISSDEIGSLRHFFSQTFAVESPEMTRFNRIVSFNAGKRAYFGRAGRELLQVKVSFDHLFIIRPYRSASVSWRFSREGKLELVDVSLRQRGEAPNHIVRIFHEQLPRDWDCAEVLFEHMPEELVYSVSSRFVTLSREERYQELVRYGHNEARHLVANLQEGLAPPKFEPDRSRGQYPMPRLKEDKAGAFILSNASRLRPELSVADFPYGLIRY